MLHQLAQPAVSAGENPAIGTRNTRLRLEAMTPVTVQYSRGFIAFGLFQDQLSSGIHSEYPTDGHTNLLVGKDVLRHRKQTKLILTMMAHDRTAHAIQTFVYFKCYVCHQLKVMSWHLHKVDLYHTTTRSRGTQSGVERASRLFSLSLPT